MQADVKIKGDTLLHWAVKKGFTEVVKLLLAKGADVNARDQLVIHRFIWQ